MSEAAAYQASVLLIDGATRQFNRLGVGVVHSEGGSIRHDFNNLRELVKRLGAFLHRRSCATRPPAGDASECFSANPG